jgi:glycosyltransferase involved in cell wall biosynthesis
LAEGLQDILPAHPHLYPQGVELMVVGKVSEKDTAYWKEHSRIPLLWRGQVAGDEIPSIDRLAHIFYSSDIHPACPNAVIEALACGLPVLAFDTGALAEIVQGDAGRVVAYGGNPWLLDDPDVYDLVQAGMEIAREQERFRPAARKRAEEMFNVQEMAARYLEALSGKL